MSTDGRRNGAHAGGQGNRRADTHTRKSIRHLALAVLVARTLARPIALLARNDASFQADLSAVEAWLKQYFDTRAKPVQVLQTTVRQLAASHSVDVRERLDMLLNDAMYGILFRDINMKRTLCDQHFSRRICALAGIVINTGEDNYLTTADAFDAAVQARDEFRKTKK